MGRDPGSPSAGGLKADSRRDFHKNKGKGQGAGWRATVGKEEADRISQELQVPITAHSPTHTHTHTHTHTLPRLNPIPR